MASTKVVGASDVSTGVLKDLFRQLADGSLTGHHLGELVQHRNPFALRGEHRHLVPIRCGDEITVHKCSYLKPEDPEEWGLGIWRNGRDITTPSGVSGFLFKVNLPDQESAYGFALAQAGCAAMLFGHDLSLIYRETNRFKFKVIPLLCKS